MKALAIDLGLKRTGFAISDELGISIKAFPIISLKNLKEMLTRVLFLCKEQDIKTVIIGCPEANTDQSKAIVKRAENLEKELLEIFSREAINTKVILWDESYTSKMAKERLLLMGIKRSKRKELLDGYAASIMLEEYLQSQVPSNV